jgi:hypothetical protein
MIYLKINELESYKTHLELYIYLQLQIIKPTEYGRNDNQNPGEMVRIKGRTSEEYHKEDSPNAHPKRKHVSNATLVTKKGGCGIDFVTLSP